MLPLALILKAWGHEVAGSDRAHDLGRLPEKFAWIEGQQITLFPQNGAGLTADFDYLIVSAAIESTIPEIVRARELGVPILTRAQLLSQIFNAAETRVAVAGTSGKSTTTGMVAWILSYVASQKRKSPTMINGAPLLNFAGGSPDYSAALVGDQNLFVAECDESDGSIVQYHPSVGILNNIALDHQPMSELIPLFDTYLGQCQTCILNLSNTFITDHLAHKHRDHAITFGWGVDGAGVDGAGVDGRGVESVHFNITDYCPSAQGASAFVACHIQGGQAEEKAAENGAISQKLTLSLHGRHNVENAVAAMAACYALGVCVAESAAALSLYLGVARRLQTIGVAQGITVIDDFAHNPDKIAATLATLHETKGRLLVVFQMHGYGPLRLMRRELIDVFKNHLRPARGESGETLARGEILKGGETLAGGDLLYMPEVLYMGGTADKSYSAKDFAGELNVALNAALKAQEIVPTSHPLPPALPPALPQVRWFEKREDILAPLVNEARAGDRIIVMGARDDTLTIFAQEILQHIAKKGS